MLRQRVITAVVLLALLLPALFAASSLPFALFTLLLISAAGWEWARLNGAQAPLPALATGAMVALMCGASLLQLPQMGYAGGLWWAGTAVWVVGGAWVLRGGPAGWPTLPKWLRWALGPLLLWLAWLAMAQARTIGINFLLSAMCVVWVADISAYFCGRAFGKRKLALAISPGKSWEGVWGGMAGVVLLSVAWTWLDRSGATVFAGSLYARLWAQHGVLVMLLGVVFLAAMSVVGDLVESLVKRSAGAKDSSGLLPGHGGVLDRVDALLPAVPLAMMLVSL